MRSLGPLLLAWVSLLALAQAQKADPEVYFKKRNEVLGKCTERHLELGLWCRDKGLMREANGELLLARELSKGRNTNVVATLAALGQFDGELWKKRARPSPAARRGYPTRAEELVRKDQGDRLALAGWALGHGLVEEAFGEYESIVRARKQALSFDSQGRLLLEAGPLPLAVSERLRAQAIAINSRLYLRDDFLRHLPALERIWEVESELLRVRGSTSEEHTAAMHALGAALLPVLEEDLGGRPTEQLDLFLFGSRADYTSWLTAAGLEEQAVVSGFAHGASGTAVVCCEDLGIAGSEAIVLHELTHLYDLALSRARLPDWYREGLAEQYGGDGTYRWDPRSGRLETRGLLVDGELDELRRSPGSVAEILAFDALATWKRGKVEGRLGYARCWAFVRYLTAAAPPALQESFQTWIEQCRGAGLGAAGTELPAGDPSAAAARFQALLGTHLSELEKSYATYASSL